jgi:hypothetical protein
MKIASRTTQHEPMMHRDRPQAVLKTRSEWLDQTRAASAAWEALEPRPADMAALIELAPRIAFDLIQAIDALGGRVSMDLKEWVVGEGRFL